MWPPAGISSVFTSVADGLAPASGGGTTNFLRADGTWAVPADSVGITQLTGDVTAGPGSGSQTATIANLAVTNAKIANATINLTTKVTGVLPIANGGTNNGSLAVTAGGTLYTDGSKLVNVGAGSAGQVLTSNGASPPTWQSGGGGGANTALSNLASTDVNAPIGTADNMGFFANSNDITISTGNTDTGTPGTLKLQPGTATDTTRGDIDATNARIINVGDPMSNGSAAANANYVDQSKISPYSYIKVGGGNAPTITPNANAGSGASAVMQIHARNLGGQFSLTTGTGTSAGAQVRIDYFSLTYSTTSYAVLIEANTNAGAAKGTSEVYLSSDSTGFTIFANNALSASTTYTWNYIVMGD